LFASSDGGIGGQPSGVVAIERDGALQIVGSGCLLPLRVQIANRAFIGGACVWHLLTAGRSENKQSKTSAKSGLGCSGHSVDPYSSGANASRTLPAMPPLRA
jgi:hypothetical protein